MYDFIKAEVPPQYSGRLLSNPKLDFERKVRIKTGELTSPKSIGYFKGAKIIVYDSGYAEFQGSLHKIKNNGVHNADNLTAYEVTAIIQELSGLLGFDFGKCRLVNLEAGVNIVLPIEIDSLLNNLLIHHQSQFKTQSLPSGSYLEAKHQQYYVKVYDKYSQYCDKLQLPANLMRYELKYIKSKLFNKLGVYCVSDLKKPEVKLALGNELVSQWQRIILYDCTIKSSDLRPDIASVNVHQWQNTNYWLRLSKEARKRQKDKYNKVVSLYSDNIQAKTASLIAAKWSELNMAS